MGGLFCPNLKLQDGYPVVYGFGVEAVQLVQVQDGCACIVLGFNGQVVFACGYSVASSAGDVAVNQSNCCVGCNVAQIDGVPQEGLISDASFDEGLHVGSQGQTGNLNVTAGILDALGNSGATNGGGNDEALQLGILVQQSLGLVEGLLILVIAVYNAEVLDVG